MMNPDYKGRTIIPDRIKHWAEKCPEQEVFVFYGDAGRRSLTCKDVYFLSRKFAALLQRRGLKHGDIVCNTLSNSPERLVTDFGIMTAGCVTANAQALLADGTDLMHVVQKSNCRLLVADGSLENGAWQLFKPHLKEITGNVIKSSNVPSLNKVELVSVSKNEGFLEKLRDEGDPTNVNICPEDTAVVLTTSGSTGFSKLVPRSHKQVLFMAADFMEVFQLKANDVIYSDRPLGWAGGWPYMYMASGGTTIMCDTTGLVKDPFKSTFDALVKENVSFAVLTTSFLNNVQNTENTLRINSVLTNAVPLHQGLLSYIGSVCNRLVGTYGLTEVGYVASIFFDKVNRDLQENIVGYPSQQLEVKIVDENYEPVKVGNTGLLLIRGPAAFKGYLNDPEVTKSALTHDGWVITGDLGCMDEKGRLFVEGRKSDVIRRGVYTFYPSWIEKTLRTCPLIQNVMVVAVPDANLGHEICACVIPKPNSAVTEEILQELCAPMFVSNELHQMSANPRYYLLVKEFPQTGTGKPDKRTLSKLAAAQLDTM